MKIDLGPPPPPPLKSNPKNVYELDGVVLENIQSEKYLGVTVNYEMDWDENIK